MRTARTRSAGTAVSSGPVRGPAAFACGSARPLASLAARCAGWTSGASGTSGANLAGLAVLPAVSARFIKRKAGAVQSRVPARAPHGMRHCRAPPPRAAATTLANYHGQHDCSPVGTKRHGCGRDRGPGTATAATATAGSCAAATAGTRATATSPACAGKRVVESRPLAGDAGEGERVAAWRRQGDDRARRHAGARCHLRVRGRC